MSVYSDLKALVNATIKNITTFAGVTRANVADRINEAVDLIEDLETGLPAVYHKQGGNTYGATMTQGTLDATGWSVFTNGSANTRYNISSAGVHTFTGNVGMGISPTSPLHVQGTTNVDVVKLKSTFVGSGTLSPRIAFENSPGNSVRIGCIDNAQVFAVWLGTINERFRVENTGANFGTFQSTADPQNLLAVTGSFANTSSNSTGIKLTISGASGSVGGYDMMLANVNDNETNTGGNRNLMRLQFNSADAFTVHKSGKLTIATGTNKSVGTATLVAGTVTVNTSVVTAASKIFVTVNTPGGTRGFLSVPTASIVAGTSFVINSDSATDTSTVNWWIIN